MCLHRLLFPLEPQSQSPKVLCSFLQNLYRLPVLQCRAKYLQAVKEGQYTPVASGDIALELATQKQEERLKMVSVKSMEDSLK